MCQGIAQGSILSSLLCSLVYGHLETHCFKDLVWNDFVLPKPDESSQYTSPTVLTQMLPPSAPRDSSSPKGKSKTIILACNY